LCGSNVHGCSAHLSENPLGISCQPSAISYQLRNLLAVGYLLPVKTTADVAMSRHAFADG
jgi:hypothetical protein